MNRYPQNEETLDSNGKRKLNTFIIPSLSTPNDTYIRVIGLERLDLIADEFYGDPLAWPIIAAANSLGKGTLMVKSGTVLRVPVKNGFTEIIRTKSNNR